MKKYLTKGMKGIYNYATGKKSTQAASGNEEEKKQEESKDSQIEESKTKVVTKPTPTCG